MTTRKKTAIAFIVAIGLGALACEIFSVNVGGGVTVTAITNLTALPNVAQTVAAEALTQAVITPVESAFAPGNPTAIPPSALTGTPPPFNIQPEAILILDPPVGASVTSPVHVAGEADPTFEQSLVVQIADESGAVIATVPAQIAADLGHRGPFAVDVSFTVAAEQPGRISVFAVSARDGGLTHLSSVEVTLRP
jgi:hypothetical protein